MSSFPKRPGQTVVPAVQESKSPGIAPLEWCDYKAFLQAGTYTGEIVPAGVYQILVHVYGGGGGGWSSGGGGDFGGGYGGRVVFLVQWF